VSGAVATASAAWVVKPLAELSDAIQYGYTAKAKSHTDGIRYLRITDIQDDQVDWSTVPSCDVGDTESEKYLLSEGDLVFARTGATVGKSFLLRGIVPRAVFASYLIRVKLRSDIDPKYVAYFFQSPAYWNQIAESSAGIGQPNVNGTKLAQIRIPVAPPSRQQEIVAEIEKQFSRLDEAVANLQRVKANLKRYKASVLKEAVEGRLVPLEAELARRDGRSFETGEQLLQRILETRREEWSGKRNYREPATPETTEQADLPTGWAWASPDQLSASESYSLAIGPFGSSLKVSDYTTEGVPLVFVRNIRAVSFGGPETVFVTSEKAAELKAHIVEAGDILVTKMGAPPGDVCMYPKTRPPAVITADCIKLRLVKKHISAAFFGYAIESKLVQTQIQGITKGVAQLKVSLGNFSALAFPLPPVEEQQRIVAEVDRRLSLVRGVEMEVDANLKRAQALRQATLAKAFSA